jgi:hypothetical protein
MSDPTPAPPAPPAPPASGPDHRWLYWSVGAVVVVLVIVGLITYSGNKDDREAQQKAEQLTQKLEAAGLNAPEDQDIITRSLGTDGGAVCDNPASALGKAVLNDQITNGADFVGRRPVIIDKRVVQAEALILQVYCPEKLDAYRDKIDDLKTDDTLKE